MEPLITFNFLPVSDILKIKITRDLFLRSFVFLSKQQLFHSRLQFRLRIEKNPWSVFEIKSCLFLIYLMLMFFFNNCVTMMTKQTFFSNQLTSISSVKTWPFNTPILIHLIVDMLLRNYVIFLNASVSRLNLFVYV